MLSHGNLLHNVESCRLVLDTVESDRYAVLLPLFHSYMLTVGLLLPLLNGASIVLIKSLNQPQHMLREIFQHRATVCRRFRRSIARWPTPTSPACPSACASAARRRCPCRCSRTSRRNSRFR